MADNLDFNVSINLDGVSPVDVTMQDPPPGAFEVEIQSARLVTNDKEGGSGKTTIRYGVMIVEDGAAKGLTTEVVCGTDYAKNFNKAHQLNMLKGLHTPDGKYLPDAGLKGTIQITPQLVTGRRAFMYVKAPAEGEMDENTGRAARANKNFVTREMYAQAKKAAVAVGLTPVSHAPQANGAHPAGAAATGAQTPTPPTPAGNAAADLDGLFGKS